MADLSEVEPRYSRRFPPDPGYRVVYSTVEGVEGYSLPHWRAELFEADGGFASHPLAIAWLTEYPPHCGLGTMLDYLIVLDQWRGQRLAPYLVAECERRWPLLSLTERLNPDGSFRGE